MGTIFKNSVVSILLALSLPFLAVSCETAGKYDGGTVDPGTSQIVIPDKEGMTVKGIVINSRTREPLEGVLVSDGRLFTETDEEGIYYLPTDLNTQRCVFVCVPSGYEVPMNSSGCFDAWKSLTSRTSKDVHIANFSLTPSEDPTDRYQVVICGDPQVKTTDESIPSFEYVVEGLSRLASEASIPQYTIYVGDLVYNETDLFGRFKQWISMSRIPTFCLPGNHDHTPGTQTEYDAISEYIKAFGPNNYSANIGKIHYIFLDSIIWQGTSYRAGLDEEALEFLENDLKHVSRDTPVFICTHVPMTRYKNNNTGSNRVNFDRFNNLIAGYKVYGWYGHMHDSYFASYTDEDIAEGLTKAASLESNSVVRCTGALGMNKEISTDGIPRGYVVVNIDGTDVSWRYSTVGDYENEQLLVYSPEMTGENRVYANVFLYDNRWGKVEWWEDGKKKGNMMVWDGTDPMYEKLYRDNKNQGTSPTNSEGIGHIFYYTPSADAVSGEVRVRDRFGNEWSQKVDL